jgi:hypothetical protein
MSQPARRLYPAGFLLSRLTDAFRAGGFPPRVSERFITRLQRHIAAGQRLDGVDSRVVSEGR